MEDVEVQPSMPAQAENPPEAPPINLEPWADTFYKLFCDVGSPVNVSVPF